jgi:outer membrane protein
MKKFLFILFLSFPFVILAQKVLTVSDAIDTALLNNFEIRIAKNVTEINKLNNSFGVAGGLPSINITANDNHTLYNLDQKLSTGTDISKKGVTSNSFNTGLSASMVLFNGFKITATKEKLDLLQNQSELELNLQIQNTIAAVMVTYFEILRQQSYLNIMHSSIEVSSQKSDVVKELYNVGMANEADLLQAEMDLTLSEQNLISQQVIIDQEKINLQTLMGVKQFFSSIIKDTILIDKTIIQDSVLNFLENNPEYLSSAHQVKINEQIVKELRAQRYPSIRVSTGYNFIYNSSSAGFNLFTQNYGPILGATMQIPIFNGTIYSTQQRVASYNVRNAELQKESLLTSLKADVIKTYQSYETVLQQIDAQRINYEHAGRLVEIVMERFRVNQTTILEVKAAQASFERAGYQLINMLFSAKVAEIELKRLTYSLGI